MRDDDLSDEQRAWMPATAWDGYRQWPCAGKVEITDGLVLLTDTGGWDWRSVATAARAFPGWQVELRGDGILTVTPTNGGDRTEATLMIVSADTPPTSEAPSDTKATRSRASKPVLAWFAEAITGAWICLVVALNAAFRSDSSLVVGTLLLAAGMIVLMRLDARREYYRGWADSRLQAAVLSPRREWQPANRSPQRPREPWQRSALFATATRNVGPQTRRLPDDADPPA